MTEDQLELRIDGRSLSTRVGDNRLRDGTYRLRVPAPVGTETTAATLRDHRNQPATDKMVAMSRATDVGYDIELAIPASLISEKQGGETWHSFQMTAIVNDVDEAEKVASRVLWHGTAEVDSRNSGYGHFVRTR